MCGCIEEASIPLHISVLLHAKCGTLLTVTANSQELAAETEKLKKTPLACHARKSYCYKLEAGKCMHMRENTDGYR